MDEQQIRQIIREELAFMVKNKKLVFPFPIQILDGNDITLGKTTGTRLGNGTDQKLAFLGSTPRTRAGLGVLIQPTGGATIDYEARAGINDLNSLLGSVSGFGLAETTY
jgi:hypothetical protein